MATEAELDAFYEALEPYYRTFIAHAASEAARNPDSVAHPDNMRKAGLKIRAARKTAGLSREEVADALGVTATHYAAFEGGLIPPQDVSDDYLERLSKVLDQALAKNP